MKGEHGMLSKAQSKRYTPQPSLDRALSLSTLEKGLLRWSMAERGDKVLDANVGNGLMLEYLQRNMECEVCGVSDDMESVRASRSRLRNADIVYATREDIPWKENTFDSVYVKLLAAPLTKADLKEILRVLKPGGQLLVGIVTVPAMIRHLTALLRLDAEEELVKPITRANALELMRDDGLTQITWQRTGVFHGVGIGWKPL